MNSCDFYLENLSAYLDGELSEPDKKAFEEHIRACEACSGELEVMKTIISSCGELEEELPEGFEASLHKRLEAAKEDAEAQKHKIVRIRMFSQIAAGFVLVIALGLMVRSGLFNSKTAESTTAQDAAPMAAAAPNGAGQASGTAQAQDSADQRSTGSAEADSQESRAYTTTMRTVAPGATESPELMAKSTESKADDGKNKAEENITPAEGEKITSLAFSEAVAFTDRVEGQDTLVTIQVEDVKKALDSITAIEEKLGDQTEAETNRETLSKSKETYGGESDKPVELKLVYSNDELWQKFLIEMQGAFPGLTVESVTAREELEYIRVLIVKVK